MNDIAPDWTAIIIVFTVIILPLLLILVFLGYRKYLQEQRKTMNDELIVKLAREGQTLTPELIDTIRNGEEVVKESNNASAECYNKLCTGGALVIGGLIVLLRNRMFAIIMMLIGLLVMAQGLALYLTLRKQQSEEKGRQESTEKPS